MDTYEILSTVRNYSGLETEDEIGTTLLRRYSNLGMMFVGQILLPLYHEFMVTTKSYQDQTGSSVAIPGDTLRVLDIEREDSNTQMRLCTKVPVEDKALIGKNANYPNDENYPSYVHEGRNLAIFPALSTTDVNVRYRRRLVDMAEGPAAYNAATQADLGGNALPDDDVYNDYDFAIYTRSATALTLQGIYKCTDYEGANKRITLDGSSIFADDGTVYYYALVPIIPAEFHNFIVDAGVIELKKAKKYQDETGWKDDQRELSERIAMTLQVHGVVSGD